MEEILIEYNWNDLEEVMEENPVTLVGGNGHHEVIVRELYGLQVGQRYVAGPNGELMELQGRGFALQLNPTHPLRVKWFTALILEKFYGLEGFTLLYQEYVRRPKGGRFDLRKETRITYVLL